MVQMARFFEKEEIVIFAIEKVSGVANPARSCVTIRGTKYSKVTGQLVVKPGEEVIFLCYGKASDPGYVVIDEKEVVRADSSAPYGASATYTWSVPDGISKVSVSFENKDDTSGSHGRTTVTTS